MLMSFFDKRNACVCVCVCERESECVCPINTDSQTRRTWLCMCSLVQEAYAGKP